MSDRLVTIEGAPRPPVSGADVRRIVASMSAAGVLAGAVLGAVYIGTDRYQRAAELRTEREAIASLLDLDASAEVTEVHQSLTADLAHVVYEARRFGEDGEPSKTIVFTRHGALVSADTGVEGGAAGAEPAAIAGQRRVPLGRLFAARRDGAPAGFVAEGVARGYKNRIRFLVGLDRGFAIAGVRVLEHEEDPGLGAEIVTPVFRGQFIARRADDLPALEVTRDPMPEDWAVALSDLSRMPAGGWRERHRTLVERERERPIYAITGATISSVALTDGVRATVNHFRRRWALLEPHLASAPRAAIPGGTP